jgi:hypothetical protein
MSGIWEVVIALAYIRKRIGEADDPWGNPALNGLGDSLRPSKQNKTVQPGVNDLANWIRYCGICR